MAEPEVPKLRSLRRDSSGFYEGRIDRKLFHDEFVKLLGIHRHGLDAEFGKLLAHGRHLTDGVEQAVALVDALEVLHEGAHDARR